MEKKTEQQLDKLPGWLSVHEGQFLRMAALKVRNLPGRVVEIGSFQGKSTIWLASSNQHITAIDPHQGNVDDKKMQPTLAAFLKNIRDFRVSEWVTLIRKTSSAAAYGWKEKIKLLFIDGLHDEANAGYDYRTWSGFVVEGGIVAMHDAFCGWEGAGNVAMEHIVYGDEWYEVGVVGSIVYGVRGRGTLLTRLNRLRQRVFISLGQRLHRTTWLPRSVSFFLIHRVIKLLLLNRFTLRRE